MTHSTHPDPLLERAQWRSLDGPWAFAYDDVAQWTHPHDVSFDRQIMVPYPPESAASGIHDESFHPVVWYARTVELTEEERPVRGERRLLLHFGAVDYRAEVWVNGVRVAGHEGGHTPFVADVTGAVQGATTLEIALRAEDDPQDFAQPRGKQDWRREPHEIWYPRTSGIWQTVWLEVVPETRVGRLTWTPHLEQWEIGLDVKLAGAHRPGLALRVELREGGELLASDRYAITGNEVARRVALPDPGIDDHRNELLWSPNHPTLIGATVELLDGERVLDKVSSYTALRSVGHDGRRFLLNGHSFYPKMVLDQGYWPDSLLAATDEQLRRDVELTKRLGFNGARKHQKIESPRWLYWCDVLGLLVWEEMPSTYRFTGDSVGRLTREWTEAIERDRSHPCIVAWVPFNESWGVPDLPSNPAHRDLVRALYHLTKTLDPTRLVIGNDGWEHVATDILGIHDYTHKPEKLLERYGNEDATARTLSRPWGRTLVLAGERDAGLPVMLTEFGGVAFAPDEARGWGYQRSADSGEFLASYQALLGAVHECEGLSGLCYTQLTDTFQEKNGLLYEDRTPKADLAALAQATSGERYSWEVDRDPNPDPLGYAKRWRERQREREGRREELA